MKKPKIIVYHNIILDKKIFIVVFVRQPLDFDRARELLKKYSSLVYSSIPTGENAVTFIEKNRWSRKTPTNYGRIYARQINAYDIARQKRWA